jgi:cycloeucalenol cycloisomerase
VCVGAAVVIALSSYEQWGEWSYMIFCAACALPLLVLPLALPSAADRKLPWHERYIIKANLWVAIFSFIGNYWCALNTTLTRRTPIRLSFSARVLLADA